MTTIPRRTAGVQKRAPLRHSARVRLPVSRPSRPKLTTPPRRTAGVQKRAPLLPEPSRARPCHGFAALETKSDDPSTQNRGGPKARAATARAPEPSRVRPCQSRGGPKARRYRQSTVEDALATVSRPSRPQLQVTTLPRRTAGVQKRAPLPPEPSRARPCHGFAPFEAKSDDPSTQNRRGSKSALLPPEPSRVRPCHGFAALETKSDDSSTHNSGRPKARAATAREMVSVRCSVSSLVCLAWCAGGGGCVMCVGSWLVYVARRVRWCALLGVRAVVAGGRAAAGERACGRRRECKLKTKTPHNDVGNNNRFIHNGKMNTLLTIVVTTSSKKKNNQKHKANIAVTSSTATMSISNCNNENVFLVSPRRVLAG